MDTLAAKNAFVREAIDREMLIFFEHDPAIAAGYIREENGKRRVVPAVTRSVSNQAADRHDLLHTWTRWTQFKSASSAAAACTRWRS